MYKADLDTAISQAALQQSPHGGSGIRNTGAGSHDGDQVIPVPGNAHHTHHNEHDDKRCRYLAKAIQDASAKASQSDHKNDKGGAANHVRQAKQRLNQCAAASHAGTGRDNGGEKHHDIPDQNNDLANHGIIDVDRTCHITIAFGLN